MCQDCEQLYQKLKEQSHQLYTQDKMIQNLRSELKRERKTKKSLVREKKQFEKSRMNRKPHRKHVADPLQEGN